MKKFIFVVVISLLFAGNLMALPFNNRPVTPGDSDLQNFFNAYVTGATYNAVSDQNTAALFQATGTGSVTSFVFSLKEGGSYVSGDQFGIYSNQTGMLVPIFNLNGITSSVLPTATVYFVNADSDGIVDDVIVSGPGGIAGTYYNFGADVFGYYTQVGGSNRFTEDSLNGGQAWALTYQGHGGTLNMPGGLNDVTLDSNHWLVAFETASAGLYDYDDLIVTAESIAAVPEPATMLLLGLGLLGLGFIGRKRLKNK